MERRLAATLREMHEAGEIGALDPSAVSVRLSPRDRYAGLSAQAARSYLGVGQSALTCIESALRMARRHAPEAILDYACGHGRVHRMLRAAFPQGRLTACDVDPEMVEFCRREFGSHGICAIDDPARMTFDESFDLIWCGSLFTHLEMKRWTGLLGLFAAHVQPEGLVLFTTHGECVAERIRRRTFDYGLDEKSRVALLDGYERYGFGYSRYPSTSSYYGVSLSTPGIVRDRISAAGLRPLMILEHGWDNHQDVFVCSRTEVSVNSPEHPPGD